MRCLSALPLLCVMLAASQPARAATVTSEASMTVADQLSVTASQNLLVGAADLLAVQIPRFVTAGTLARVATTQAIAIATGQGGGMTQRVSGLGGRGAVQQASFVIMGDSDRSVSIAVPQSVALSRLGGSGEQLQFDAETSFAANELGQSRLGSSAGGSGQLAFDVGGKVRLAGDTVAGDYAGVLKVTVQYN